MPKTILPGVSERHEDFPPQTVIMWDRGFPKLLIGVVVEDPRLFGRPNDPDPRAFLASQTEAPSVGWFQDFTVPQLDELLNALHHARREMLRERPETSVQDAPSPVQGVGLLCKCMSQDCTNQHFGDLPGDVQGEIAAELSPLDPAQGRPLKACQDDEPHGEHPWTRGGPRNSQERLYCRGVDRVDLGLRDAGRDPV